MKSEYIRITTHYSLKFSYTYSPRTFLSSSIKLKYYSFRLQARVLAEEWEKREELERLQDEQRFLLHEERQKRKEYEELQTAKEQQLKCKFLINEKTELF